MPRILNFIPYPDFTLLRLESIVFIYLTPFIPLSFKGEGGRFIKRGVAAS